MPFKKQLKIFFLGIGSMFYTSTVNSQASLHLSQRINADFDQGLYYYKIQKYEAASVHFKRAQQAVFTDNTRLDKATIDFYTASSLHRSNNVQGPILLTSFVNQYPQHPLSRLASYELGTYYASQKDYEKAVLFLSHVDLTALDEEDKIECNFRLGYAYMNLKDFEKAGIVFQRLRNSKNKYTYAASYYLGYINYKNELYDIALLNLKKSIENQAYKNLAPALIGSIFLKTQKYDTLIKFAEHQLSLEQVKYKEDLMLLAAEAYFYIKNYKQAAIKYAEYIAMGLPVTHSHLCKYGISLYESADYNKSLQQLKKVAEYNDTLGQSAAYYLGLNWLKLDNKTFAYNAFEQARKMTFIPELQTKSTIEYLKLAVQLKDFKEVIEVAKEAQNKFKFKDNEKQLIEDMLADAYLNTHDPYTAYKYLEPIRNKTGNTARTYQMVTFYLGLELFNQDKTDEALEYFQKSLDFEYDKETYYMTNFYIGECLMTQLSYEEAIPYYTKVSKYSARLKSDMVVANQLGLAYAYFNTQDYNKSIQPFKEVLQDNTLSKEIVCDALARLGDAFFATKSFSTSLVTYQKNLDKACPFSDYILMQKGRVYAVMNKSEDAKNTFQMLIQKYPQSAYYADALYNSALIDFENTKYSQAIEGFSNLLTQTSNTIYTPLALQKRAIAYGNLKKYELSAADYQRLLKEYPTHKAVEGAVLGLQDALSKLGKSVQEDSSIIAFKRVNPQNSQLQKLEYEEAKDLYFNQKYQEAQQAITKFLQTHIQSLYHADLHYFLGDAAYKNKDYKTAELYLQKALQYEGSTYRKRAMIRYAELSTENGKKDTALVYYKKLFKEAATAKEKAQALQGIYTAHTIDNSTDSVLFYVNQLIEMGSLVPNIYYRALISRYQWAIRANSTKKLDYLIQAVNELPESYGAEALYDLAHHRYSEKKFTSSLELLFDLNQKYKGQDKWINKAFLLIADCYIAQEEIYQAKATLGSIIEKSKDQATVELAKQKLSNLETP